MNENKKRLKEVKNLEDLIKFKVQTVSSIKHQMNPDNSSVIQSDSDEKSYQD